MQGKTCALCSRRAHRQRRDLIVGGFDDATTGSVLCVRVGAGEGEGDMVSDAIMFQCYFGSGFDVIADEKTYS